MAAPQSRIKLVIVLLLAFFVQMAVLQPALADVSEVETGPQGLSETKEDDATAGEPVKGDADLPWWKKALNELGDIKDSAIDGLKEFGDWAADEWNDFTDYASKKFDEFGDWAGNVWNDIENFFAENKWAQTIVAAIAATAIIVGAIAILVVTGVVSVPILVVAAIVGAGALAGGFLYQWLAGDGYNFWGAFGSSLVGGILAYAGYASGAFAAGWAWLRHTAGPAAWAWARNTAWPWIVGRGQAAWRWMSRTAWPWLRGKGAAAWRWFKMRPVWGQLRGFYTASNMWKLLVKGAYLGALTGGAASFLGSVFSYPFTGEGFTLKGLLWDMGIGAVSGALLGPILLSGATLSLSTIIGVSLFGSFENWLGGGLKDGEWGSWLNPLTGFGVAFLSTKFLGDFVTAKLGSTPQEISDTVTKSLEEVAKNAIKEGTEKLTGPDSNPNSDTKTDTESNNEPDKPKESIEDKPEQSTTKEESQNRGSADPEQKENSPSKDNLKNYQPGGGKTAPATATR
jgi:hypothetical protein